MAGTSTPARLRQGAALAVLGVVAVVALMVPELSGEATAFQEIDTRSAAAVTAASDVYFALNDMDAQVANALLVGDNRGLGFTRDQALDLYDQRRQLADHSLRAAASAVTDPATLRDIDSILDDLGRYQALAGQALLLDRTTAHAPGRPAPSALAQYRQATDLLATRLLPTAHRLTDRHAATLEATYSARHAQILTTRWRLILAGGLLLAALVGLHLFITIRFRRLIAPALACAVVVVGVGVLATALLLTLQAEHLRVAKKDAFDSLLALRLARAVSYDANADESRYLLDPTRAAQYETAFSAKSQELVRLDGATLATWDRGLAAALDGYRRNNADVGWGGYLGTEFGNITFPRERVAAERTLAAYQAYQLDDRKIRDMVAAGHLDQAVAFCTSYAPGASNNAFAAYDQAMTELIAINQHAFETAIADGNNALTGWVAGAWALAAVTVLLVATAIRPRLAEYA
jgi:hypothetical protein